MLGTRIFQKINGPNPASICLFSFFFTLNVQIYHKFENEKSVDGVLGSRTWGGRMEGADESTELWRHLYLTDLFILFKQVIIQCLTEAEMLSDCQGQTY